MNESVDRTLAVFEALARYPGGVPLARIADAAGMPTDDAQALLAELVRCCYVCRVRSGDDTYALTTKLSGLGLVFLTRSRVADVAQPMLERLAQKSGEVVRLSIVDGDRLPWMARAQGTAGLRYDTELGNDAQLSCSATGHAWLLTLSDDDVARLVHGQGLGQPGQFGPSAPATLAALLDAVREARARGYGLALESLNLGVNSIAVPVRAKGEPAIGVISIAGPAQRLSEARMHELAPAMVEAAAELAAARGASQLLIRAGAPPAGPRAADLEGEKKSS